MDKNFDKSHGSPYDRGCADAHYDRPKNPHKYPNGTYNHPHIGEKDLTTEEIEAYHYGYDNEKSRAD